MHLIGERCKLFNQIKIMKNPSSLFLTLASYLIMLAAILFMLFMAIPMPLKAQTNADMVTTNMAVTNAAAQSAVVMAPGKPSPAPVVEIPGIHIGRADSSEGSQLVGALAIMIPIVAIVMGCSIPIIIVGLTFYFCHRKHKMLHETVRAMVDKGVPIPPEIFSQGTCEPFKAGRAKRLRNDFRNGLLFLGVGLGVIIVAGKPGWIILFLGIAFLVASMFEKKSDDQQPPKP
jgi:Domain of unknown function (DUF6249)